MHLLVVHSDSQGWIQPVDTDTLAGQNQPHEMSSPPMPLMEIATPHPVGFGNDYVPKRVYRRTPVSSGKPKPKGRRAREILQDSFNRPVPINRPPEATLRPVTLNAPFMEPNQHIPPIQPDMPEENDHTMMHQSTAAMEDVYTLTSTPNLMTVNTSVPLTTQIQVPPTGLRRFDVNFHLGLIITVDPETGDISATFKEASMDPIPGPTSHEV